MNCYAQLEVSLCRAVMDFLVFFSVLCCTLNAVPETKNLLTKSKLPLGIHLHPFKDLQASYMYITVNTNSCSP